MSEVSYKKNEEWAAALFLCCICVMFFLFFSFESKIHNLTLSFFFDTDRRAQPMKNGIFEVVEGLSENKTDLVFKLLRTQTCIYLHARLRTKSHLNVTTLMRAGRDDK